MEPRMLDNKLKAESTGQEKRGIYTGSISAAGAITNAPSGWTGGSPSSSVFTVTHGLGLTANSYTVQCTVTGATKGTARVVTRATNAFTVETCDLATPTVADLAFDFLMIAGDGE